MDDVHLYRKSFSHYQKKMIIHEYLSGHLSLSQLSRKYQVSRSTLYHWRRMVEVEQNDSQKGLSSESLKFLEEIDQLKQENQHLTKALRELTIDKSILSDTVEILKKKYQQQQLKRRKK